MDRRLEILKRLPILFKDIPGILRVTRNNVAVEEKGRPEIIINDGDETASDQNQKQSVRRSPNVITMTPEIMVYSTGDHETASADLHRIRSEIIKRVYTDTTISELTGPNGDVYYGGCEVRYAAGRRLEGEMMITISFSYPLIPAAL